jgi:hypothetical protein
MRHQKYFRFLAPSNHFCRQLPPIGGESSRRATRGCVGYVPSWYSFSSKSGNTVATWTLFGDFRHFYKES